MSKLLFRMRDVPDDEAEEVRALLESNDIDYFETFSGNWGISMPALWVKDLAEFDKARSLIDAYQKERVQRMIDATDEDSGASPGTLTDSFKKRPFQFVAYWVLIAVVLFISIYYFYSF